MSNIVSENRPGLRVGVKGEGAAWQDGCERGEAREHLFHATMDFEMKRHPYIASLHYMHVFRGFDQARLCLWLTLDRPPPSPIYLGRRIPNSRLNIGLTCLSHSAILYAF